MARAIQLARQAEPQSVSPNPHVGAVLVYDEDPNDVRIIGEGYHKKRGEGHAEVECLRSVRDEDKFLIQHATMYVTLEPCAHVGRTPSCASMLVERGLLHQSGYDEIGLILIDPPLAPRLKFADNLERNPLSPDTVAFGFQK